MHLHFQGLARSRRLQSSNRVGQMTKTLASCDIGGDAGELHIESHRQGMSEAGLLWGHRGCKGRFLLYLLDY